MYCICCVENSKSDYVFYGWPQMEYDMPMKQTSVQRSSRGQSWVRSWERGGSGWGDSGKASILEGSIYPTWKSGLSRIGYVPSWIKGHSLKGWFLCLNLTNMDLSQQDSKRHCYLSQNVKASSERCLSMNKISKPCLQGIQVISKNSAIDLVGI